ncbi:hypothetical protein ABK040_014581 [Willaertia magna]
MVKLVKYGLSRAGKVKNHYTPKVEKQEENSNSKNRSNSRLKYKEAYNDLNKKSEQKEYFCKLLNKSPLVTNKNSNTTKNNLLF